MSNHRSPDRNRYCTNGCNNARIGYCVIPGYLSARATHALPWYHGTYGTPKNHTMQTTCRNHRGDQTLKRQENHTTQGLRGWQHGDVSIFFENELFCMYGGSARVVQLYGQLHLEGFNPLVTRITCASRVV